jgi:hypothetical protein
MPTINFRSLIRGGQFQLALIVLLTGFLPRITSAQEMDVASGSLLALRGETQLNLIFRYDSMTIGADGLSDLWYQEKRAYDLDMREPNSGREWRKLWVDNRQSAYEPAFLRAYLSLKPKLVAGHFPNARYTAIIHTTQLEPGWTAVVAGHAASIDGDIRIVATADTATTICLVHFQKAASQTKNFEINPAPRIARAYAIAGYRFGKLVKRGVR